MSLEFSFNNINHEYTSDKFTDQYYSHLTKDELLKLSSFQLLSFYLTIERYRGVQSWWKPFLDMLPTMSDFQLTPMTWNNQELVKQLPISTQLMNEEITSRFEKDYKVISDELGILNREDVLLSWLCINSRCLYMKLSTSHNSSDNFTMVPFVDFINHSDEDHCKLKIDFKGFKIITTCEYTLNSQIYLNYGPHNNDFLLCEYGFMINDNKWNDLDISNYIMDYLKPKQIEYLKQIDYFDFYTLTNSILSFRTEVVLAVIQESNPEESKKLESFINGYTDGVIYQRLSKHLLKKILEEVIFEYEKNQHLQFDSAPRKKVIGDLYRNRNDIAKSYIQEYLS
ncbi:unnamed protein product [Candida verbasci]|uniref:SET domain-containing protein n=1 Tax=Candida verbasci TaxID=1227364 RepID=A0A9W4TWR3_9ASCO|nr:unnamed protein product [Candida verbasci]